MATTKKQVAKKTEKTPEGVNGLAVSGFVLSLCGFGTGITFIVGLILSAIGLAKTKKTGQDGRGLALAGTIIGAIGTGLMIIGTIIMTIIIIVAAANSTQIENVINNAYDDCEYEYTYNRTTRGYEYKLNCD